LLVIVSFTTLSYADYAFAQTEDQANITKNIPELERMTFRVYFFTQNNGNRMVLIYNCSELIM